MGAKSPLLQKVATELGLQLTGWDVDTNDWKAPRGLVDTQKCYPSRGRWKGLYGKKGRPLDILMHVNQATANDLETFIHGLHAEGWEFRSYGDPPQRPSVAIA